ncbi:MAG: hypothetical protein WA421_03010 [Nitrososphaeraceae archaeon]
MLVQDTIAKWTVLIVLLVRACRSCRKAFDQRTIRNRPRDSSALLIAYLNEKVECHTHLENLPYQCEINDVLFATQLE